MARSKRVSIQDGRRATSGRGPIRRLFDDWKTRFLVSWKPSTGPSPEVSLQRHLTGRCRRTNASVASPPVAFAAQRHQRWSACLRATSPGRSCARRFGSFSVVVTSELLPSTCGPVRTDLMTIQQLRAAHRATPFRPFTVHMADGRGFHVPHPDFLSMSPTGRTVIIYQEGEEFSILDLLLMTEIEMGQGASQRA